MRVDGVPGPPGAVVQAVGAIWHAKEELLITKVAHGLRTPGIGTGL